MPCGAAYHLSCRLGEAVWDPSQGPGVRDGHLDKSPSLVADGCLRPDAVLCPDGVSTAYFSGGPSLPAHPAWKYNPSI